MNEMTSRDLAVLAELDYRHARLAETYQRGAPAWALAVGRGIRGLVRRVRARVASRDAVQRLGATLDAVAARTDAEVWDRQVTRRADQIAQGLDARRPQDDAGRRAA